MGKIAQSPIKRFPGSITIPDFLTVPQAQAWEECLRKSGEERAKIGQVEYIALWIPGVTAVVEEWNIEKFSHDPFQTTPRGPVIELISWIIGLMTELYYEAEEIPNG
jgi:hypothetical protein